MAVLSFTALIFGFGTFLCCKARSQFNALPPDHPHRFKYGTGYTLPIETVNGVTTYQTPPGLLMVNQALSNATTPPGYIGPHPQQAPTAPPVNVAYLLPPGSQMPNQSIPTAPTAAGQTGVYLPQAAPPSESYPEPAAGQPGSLTQPAGPSSYPSPGASQYKDDSPPPYSEVVAKE